MLLTAAVIVFAPLDELGHFIHSGALELPSDLAHSFEHLLARGLDGDNYFVRLVSHRPVELRAPLQSQLLGYLGRYRDLIFSSQGRCHIP